MKIITSLRIVPIVASLFFFLISFFFESYQVESMTHSGLQIQAPYYEMAFPITVLAVALTLFGLCFNVLHGWIERHVIELGRAIMGSAFTSLGLTVFVFSLLISWMLDTDYSTRCFAGCAQTLIQTHSLDAQLLASGAVFAVIVSAFGLLLLIQSARNMKRRRERDQQVRVNNLNNQLKN